MSKVKIGKDGRLSKAATEALVALSGDDPELLTRALDGDEGLLEKWIGAVQEYSGVKPEVIEDTEPQDLGEALKDEFPELKPEPQQLVPEVNIPHTRRVLEKGYDSANRQRAVIESLTGRIWEIVWGRNYPLPMIKDADKKGMPDNAQHLKKMKIMAAEVMKAIF